MTHPTARFSSLLSRRAAPWLSCLAAAALAACGGGSVDTTTTTPAAAAASSPDASGTSGAPADVAALPAFHMAPAMLSEPADTDVQDANATGHQPPLSFGIDDAMATLDTTRLTPQALASSLAAAARTRVAAAGTPTPKTTAITAAVYTPAQIRAAYGLPDLPLPGAAISAAVAASLGAGQTIYLIDAYDNANALADLNRFSTKFGLPTCTALALTSASTLPLATPGAACTFAVAYTDSTAALKNAAPAYDSGWAPETSLDVQWSHAIAPLARIVLVEATDSMTNNLLGGVALANKMGPGVVSMSFGATESSWVTTVDSSFTTAGMTYLASTGDGGAQVNWPAVSPNVMAVGGTSLQWSGSGTRYEAAWSGAGGGISVYEPLPAWQSGLSMPGFGALKKRAVSDLSFNANPNTGQYVAMTAPGSSTTNWNAYGGTSIAAPQWAGIVAIANAQRVAAAKARLGDFHALLYTTIAGTPSVYAAAFGDVAAGSDGTCATCQSVAGFDQPTGWGTPNAAALIPLLAGATPGVAQPVAPVVPGGAYVTKTGLSLTQPLGITAPAGVTTSYAMSGAPAGSTVDAAGELKWASPVTGSYAFTVTASTSAGKSASGSYTLKVIPYTAPVFSGDAGWSVTTGEAFLETLQASDPNSGALTFTLTGGAPQGMALSPGGVLTWKTPVAGTYALSVKVTDSYGLGATRTYALTVTAVNHAPTLASGVAYLNGGQALSARLVGNDVDGDALTYTMTGQPGGMSLSSAGILTWAKAVKGTYALKVTVRDSHGLAGAVATLTIVVL